MAGFVPIDVEEGLKSLERGRPEQIVFLFCLGLDAYKRSQPAPPAEKSLGDWARMFVAILGRMKNNSTVSKTTIRRLRKVVPNLQSFTPQTAERRDPPATPPPIDNLPNWLDVSDPTAPGIKPPVNPYLYTCKEDRGGPPHERGATPIASTADDARIRELRRLEPSLKPRDEITAEERASISAQTTAGLARLKELESRWAK